MGDYLYNSEMGPWACVSVCQAAWSTDGHTEAHLFSHSLPHILSFSGRNLVLLWSFFVFFSYLWGRHSRDPLSPHPLGSSLSSGWDFYTFFSVPVAFFLYCACQTFLFPCSPFSFLPPSSSVPCLLVCGFWAMLSSPTVILQPYGLPVYPQTTTCYPSIVQVNSSFVL